MVPVRNEPAQPSPDPRSFLPLKPDVLSILLVLLEGQSHGYAIMKTARSREGRKGQLQPGALYRLLKQMLDIGLVEELPTSPGAELDERRRYYAITHLGRRVVQAEGKRMNDLLERLRHCWAEGGPS